MSEPGSEEPGAAVFQALRDSYGGDGPGGESGEGEGRSGADLIDDLRRRAEEVLDEADKFSFAWLTEAEAEREAAMTLRHQAAEALAASKVEIERHREEELRTAREQGKAEADLILKAAHEQAADVVSKATEEAERSTQAERDRIVSEAREQAEEALGSAAAKAAALVGEAEAEAARLVAEATRAEARVLLDARARVDEVRSRLIRLHQEMEAASAERWRSSGDRTSLPSGADAGAAAQPPS